VLSSPLNGYARRRRIVFIISRRADPRAGERGEKYTNGQRQRRGGGEEGERGEGGGKRLVDLARTSEKTGGDADLVLVPGYEGSPRGQEAAGTRG
jgi:hypothetical protein